MKQTLFAFLFVGYLFTHSSSFTLEAFHQGTTLVEPSVPPSFYFQQNINDTKNNGWNFYPFIVNGRMDRALFQNRDAFALYTASQNRLYTQPISVGEQWNVKLVPPTMDLFVISPVTPIGNSHVCHITNTFNREGECHTVMNVPTNYTYFPNSKLLVFCPPTGVVFYIYHPGTLKSFQVSLPKSVSFLGSSFMETASPNTGIYFIRSDEGLMIACTSDPLNCHTTQQQEPVGQFKTLYNVINSGIVQMIENGTSSKCVVFFHLTGWRGLSNCPNLTNGLFFIDKQLPHVGVHRPDSGNVTVIDFQTESFIDIAGLPLNDNCTDTKLIGQHGAIAFYCYYGSTDNQTRVFSFNYARNSTAISTSWRFSFIEFKPTTIWTNPYTDRIFMYVGNNLSNPDISALRLGDGGQITFYCRSCVLMGDEVTIFYDAYFKEVRVWDEPKEDSAPPFIASFPPVESDQYYLAVNVNVSAKSVSLLKVEKSIGGSITVVKSSFTFSLSTNLTLVSDGYSKADYLIIQDESTQRVYTVRIVDGTMRQEIYLNSTVQLELPGYGFLFYSVASGVQQFYFSNPAGNFNVNRSPAVFSYLGNGWLLSKEYISPDNCRASVYNVDTSAQYHITDNSCITNADAVFLDQFFIRSYNYSTIYTTSSSVATQELLFTPLMINGSYTSLTSTIASPRLVVHYSNSIAMFYEFCASDTDCDDGTPCTQDACVNQICQHTPVDCNAIQICPMSTPFRCTASNSCVNSLTACLTT